MTVVPPPTYPWPKVTNLNTVELDESSWIDVYPDIKPSQHDPFQEAADFYLLFGVANRSFISYTPRKLPSQQAALAGARKLGLNEFDWLWRNTYIEELERKESNQVLLLLENQAQRLLSKLIDLTDTQFTSYVALACGGEIRHHWTCAGELPKVRRVAWAAWSQVVDFYGVEAYTTMASLFREQVNSSIGGELWAIAAELIRDRLLEKLGPTPAVNKQVFIDRVFTLQHNTGTFLNKLDWVNKRKTRSSPFNDEVESMPKTILQFQASNPPDVLGMFGYASVPVQELVCQYMNLALGPGVQMRAKWIKGKMGF